MQITFVNIGDVKNNPNNPRLIKDDSFNLLVKSIKEFPKMLEIRPIVVNNDMVVLGGNQRLRACKEAGLKKIPIIKASELTEAEQNEFIIKDNVGFGVWDNDILIADWDNQKLADWGLNVMTEENTMEEIDTMNEPLYPITPKYDEKYTAIVILVKNETNLTYLQNMFNIEKSKSYKKKDVGMSYVITDEHLIGHLNGKD